MKVFGKTRLTVITPTYNRADFLRETIKSVLSQNVRLRYIVIDDGSTDDTHRRIGWRKHFLEFIRQQNAGEVRTVNRGLRMVETEYFTVVNSDDPLLPGSLAKMVKFLDRNPDALGAYCDWKIIGPQSEDIAIIPVGQFSIEKMLTTFNLPIGPGAVFRRTCLDEIGLRNPQLRYSADLDYWFRVALTGRMAYLPEVLATHRTHPDSASVQGRGNQLSSEVAYLFQVYGNHPKRSGDPLVKDAICSGHFSAAFTCTEPKAMAHEFLRSLVIRPLLFLEHFFALGPGEMVGVLTGIGCTATGEAPALLTKALNSRTRIGALRALSLAAHRDPIGVATEIQRMGKQSLSESIRKMALR